MKHYISNAYNIWFLSSVLCESNGLNQFTEIDWINTAHLIWTEDCNAESSHFDLAISTANYIVLTWYPGQITALRATSFSSDQMRSENSLGRLQNSLIIYNSNVLSDKPYIPVFL